MSKSTINIFSLLGQSSQIPFESQNRRFTTISSADDFRKLYTNGFVFNQYSSLKDVFDYIEELRIKESENLLKPYEVRALQMVSKAKYKDYDTFLEFIETENNEKRQAKLLTENILNNIDTFINLGGLYKNDRLIVTQDERGVFDFSLASLGLYRPIEFFSMDLENDIKNKFIDNPFPNNPFGLIKEDEVKKIGNDLIYIFNKKKYICQKRQKGATKVFNKFFDLCELKPNQDNILIPYFNGTDKVFNGKNDVRLKYASTNKKSYLIFDKKDDNVKYVDVFMPLNFIGGVSDVGRVLSFIPAFLIAASLETFGIKVRISALRIGSDRKTNIAASVPVKDYYESTKDSFNKSFALLTSDSAVTELFAFLKIIAENEGIQASPTGDFTSAFDEIGYPDRGYMNDMMQRYKNWSFENKEKPFINTKVKNPNFQFSLNSENNVFYSGKRVQQSDLLREMHNMFYKYYYYMDFLALEMIPMGEFVKSIYNRFITQEQFKSLFSIPDNNDDLKQLLRDYIIAMLVEKYQSVNGGEYADTNEQKEDKNKKFQSKVDSLDDALNSIK